MARFENDQGTCQGTRDPCDDGDRAGGIADDITGHTSISRHLLRCFDVGVDNEDV